MPNDNGRNQVTQWGPDIWNRIDRAVHDEMARVRVGAKFIPLYGPLPPETRTVPSDRVPDPAGQPLALGVEEGESTSLVELSVDFRLTQSQVDGEDRLGTAIALATRAANALAGDEDRLIFRGADGVLNNQRERTGVNDRGVRYRITGDQDPLYLDGQDRFGVAAPAAVDAGGAGGRGQVTLTRANIAYATLQGVGRQGPFALALHHLVYADVNSPVAADTLDTPADRLRPLFTAGVFATSALPENSGVVVSVGGNSVDRAVGIDATTAFLQVESDGRYLFRVYERLALRVKDRQAVRRLVLAAP
jgi:uncharacterized linocin/CFP29 family protein